MRTRRRGMWLLKQPRLGARMCQGTFFFINWFYTDFTFALFLILHSDFTMQLWLRDENIKTTIINERNQNDS